MNLFKSIFATTALAVSTLSFAESAPWELEVHDEDKGIQVFTRAVEGSPLKEFKGITQIQAPVEAFVTLLNDSEAATKWMHNVIEFKVVETTSDTENLVYTVNKTPWPVTDRDVYIRSSFSADETGKVTSTLKAEAFDEKNDDYIRISSLNGFWSFTPLETGLVEVVYQVHANPGGSLPDWLVNSIVVETPQETLENLQEIIKDEKYQGQKYAFIDNAKAVTASVVAEVSAE